MKINFNQHVNRVDTRKLYKLETLFPPEKDCSMAELRELGELIWEKESGNMKMLPEIAAGQGSYYGNCYLSFCYKIANQPPKIILSRQHRKPNVLIHEMTHALGHWNHGIKFVRKYFDLLVKYGSYDYDFLLLTAYSVNIDLEKLK
jgi:hypothetical protein